MHPWGDQFTPSEASKPDLSSAACTITTFVFNFRQGQPRARRSKASQSPRIRRAERLLQAVFENLGYKARPLPPATKADLLLGRELADIGQCCPTSFTTGNLANFLKSESERIGAPTVRD